MPTLNDVARAIEKAQLADDKAAVGRLKALYRDERKRIMEARYGAETKVDDAGFFENLGKGFASGAVGSLEMMALGANALREEEAELQSRQKILALGDKFTPEGGDEDSLTYKLASGLGSMASYIPAAFAGPAALPLALGMGMASGGGEASERARAYGATEEERNAAIRRGTLIGSTEVLPVGKAIMQVSKKIGVPGLPKFLDKMSDKVDSKTITGIKSRIKSMATTGVAEGAQEATAAILQNLNEAGYNPNQVMFEMGVVEEGAIGGGSGAIFQGIVDLIAPRRAKDFSKDAPVDDSVDPDKELFEQPPLETADIVEEEKEAPKEKKPKKAKKKEAEQVESTPEQAAAIEEFEEKATAAGFGESEPAPKKEAPKKETTALDEKAKEIANRDSVVTSILDTTTDTDPKVINKNIGDALQEAGLKRSLRARERAKVNEFVQGKLGEQNVGEQVDGAPVAEASGEGVQGSGEGVVGGQPADTKRTGKPVEGGLDSGVDSAREPARREGREQPALKLAEDARKKAPAVAKKFKSRLKKEAVEPTASKEDTLPAVDSKTGKLYFRKAGKLLKDVPESDTVKLKEMMTRSVNTNISRAPSVLTALRKKPNKSKADAEFLAEQEAKFETETKATRQLENKVIKYFAKFRDPNSAILQAMYERMDPDSTLVYKEPKNQPEDMKDPLAKELEGTGGENAEAVIKWVNRNLSPETKKQVAARLREFKKEIKKSDKRIDKRLDKELAAEDAAQAKAEEGTKTKTVKVLGKEEKVKVKKKRTSNKFAVSEEDKKKRKKKFSEARKQRTKKQVDTAVKAESKAVKTEAGTKTVDDTGIQLKQQEAQNRADAKYQNFINDPKTDLSRINDYAKAVDLADKTSTPKLNRDALRVAQAKAQQNIESAKIAAKRVDAKKIEQGQAKAKQPTKKKKSIDAAMEQFSGESGVTSRGIAMLVEEKGLDYLRKEATVEEARTYSDLAKEAKEKGFDGSPFISDADAATAIGKDVSPKARKLLEQGDFKGALLDIAKTVENPDMKRIARGLAKNIGDTKVTFDTHEGILNRYKLLKTKIDPTRLIYGSFFARTNSVVFNRHVPLTIHLVMHEASHAALDVSYYGNTNSAPAKQLTRVFEELKETGELDPNNEGANIKEFMAEARSNPVFRARLGRIRDSKGLSAWRKLVNIFKNFFYLFTGGTTVPLNSTLKVLDDSTMLLMSPTPPYINGNFNLEPSPMAKSIDEALTPLREDAKAQTDNKFINFFKDLTAGSKGLAGLAKGIHIHTLADIARATGFGRLGHELHEIINRQTGRIFANRQIIKDALKQHKEFGKRVGEEASETYDRLIYNHKFGATLYDVNPFAPNNGKKYEGKYVSGNSLKDVYDMQQKQLSTLEDWQRKELKQHYEAQKKLYKEQFAAVIRAIKQESASILKDNPGAQKQLDKITQTLFARATIEEYFPLVRQGDFSVSYNYIDDKGTKQKGFEMFKHASERDAYAADLKGVKGVTNVDKHSGEVTSEFFDGAPSGSFVSEILIILENAGIDEGVRDGVIRQFVNTLPATSIYKSLVRRGNVYGYVGNSKLALETKGMALAAQSAKIESGAEIRAKMRELKKKNKELANEKAKAIYQSFVERSDFAIYGAPNKTMEAIYKEFNQVAFLYTLGFNVSSALVNMTQIPLVAIPYLTPRFGLDNVMAAFGRATRLVGGSKVSIVEYYDVNNGYTLKADIKKNIEAGSETKAKAKERIDHLESLIPLIREAHQQGKLYSGETLVELGVNEEANKLDKLAHLSAWFFNGAERFNTQTTMMASYDLIRQQMGEAQRAGKKYFSVREGADIEVPADVDEIRSMAAKEALYTAQEVNGGARLETTSPLLQKGIFRVGGMYKSYGIMMNSSMIKSGLAAANKLYKDNPKQRKIAIKQLAGLHLSSAFFAGLGGIPIWGLVSMLWDMYLDDDEDDADTILRKGVGEFFYKGPLSTLSGMDVAARVKLNDLLIQPNRFMRDPSLEETLGHFLGGPFLSTIKRGQRGFNDFMEGEYIRAAEAAFPAGFGNLVQGGRYLYEGGIRNRADQFIYEDIGAGEIASKMFGFSPTNYTFITEQSARDTRISNAVQERSSKLKKRYHFALFNRDYNMMKEVLDEIAEFNTRHPYAGISSEALNRSLKAQAKTAAESHNGVRVSPMMRIALAESWSEYKEF